MKASDILFAALIVVILILAYLTGYKDGKRSQQPVIEINVTRTFRK